MPWQKLTLHLPAAQIDPLSDLLHEMGALAITLEAHTQEELFEPPPNETPLWDSTSLHALFELDTHIPALLPLLEETLAPEKFAYQITEVAEENWQKRVQDTFHATCFSHRLWVYPSWQPPPTEDTLPRLLLDPGLAFGTGTHPTTALCLEWLAETIQGGETVIDYGCGSGILGLAALKLGARTVWAVDNDPQALEATEENARRNAETQIQAVLPTALPPLQVDILIANILANPLIALAPHFATCLAAGGKIALSGILAEQAEQVMQAYLPWFRFDPPVQKEQWVRLVGEKSTQLQPPVT